MSVKELFHFITSTCIPCPDSYLDAFKPCDNSNEIEEEVFFKSFIPLKLDQVINLEREINHVNEFGVEDLIYKNISGVCIDLKNVLNGVESIDEQSDDVSSECGSEQSTTEEGEGGGGGGGLLLLLSPSGSKEEIKAARKENKKIVKEENREKRKNKMPKSEKKKLIKGKKGR